MADSSPTVRRRQLGMELRRLRDTVGKDQKEAGDYIGVSDSMISKYETGDRRIKVGYVRLLCELYDVDAPHKEFLVRLVRESDERGWWADYGNTVPSWFKDFLGMETAAEQIHTYHSELVPGLLQTPDYIRGLADGAPTDQVEQTIEIRSTRQKRLTEHMPLQLWAVINEAVLRRDIGGREVMLGQLRHLVEMAELPNITIQVVPFSVGFHPAMASSFTLLRFSGTPVMDAVFVDLKGGAVFMEKPPDVERHVTDFRRLTSDFALQELQTKRLLQEEIERR
ncbi:MAG: helix-turn-helix domain-containing protein [Pseudonocardiaceae bacterium]